MIRPATTEIKMITAVSPSCHPNPAGSANLFACKCIRQEERPEPLG
jgi:hypothetical protein